MSGMRRDRERMARRRPPSNLSDERPGSQSGTGPLCISVHSFFDQRTSVQQPARKSQPARSLAAAGSWPKAERACGRHRSRHRSTTSSLTNCRETPLGTGPASASQKCRRTSAGRGVRCQRESRRFKSRRLLHICLVRQRHFGCAPALRSAQPWGWWTGCARLDCVQRENLQGIL